MLKQYFYSELQQVRMSKQIIFHQDGAPAHYGSDVRGWLNEKFPGKRIDRRGVIEWAPDLPPCEFFLWIYLKHNVYSQAL